MRYRRELRHQRACLSALFLSFLSYSAAAQEAAPAPTEAAAPAADGATPAADPAAPQEAEGETPAAEGEGAESENATPAEGEAEAAAPPKEPEVDPYAEAKERVGRAEKLYEDGNYDAALTEFQRAYDTMLGHPARPYVLFNVGRCQEKLYRYDEAIASYKKYLEEAGKDAEDRQTVQAKIELLEGLLGTLVLDVSAGKGASLEKYEVWVDGRLIGENSERLLIPGGNHEVQIRAEGFESVTQQVQLASRAKEQLLFVLQPLAEEYKGLPQPYFWAATSVAVAAGAAGGVFGIMTITKRKELDGEDPAGITEKDVDALKARALTADILFISAGVFATSATVLGFMTDWSSPAPTTDSNPIRVKEVGLAPTPGGGFLSVGGTF